MLADRGTLVAKTARGHRAWAVRFVLNEGGQLIHKSVYLGGEPELVERGGSPACEYRATGRWAGEVEAFAQLHRQGAGGVARLLASSRGRPG